MRVLAGLAMNGSYPGLNETLNTTGWSVKWMSAFLVRKRAFKM
jgi:hypothetical protein